MKREFPYLEEAAGELGSHTGELSLSQLRALLCRDCDFYGDDHEDKLECSCFQILGIILKRGVLTPQQLAEAAGPEEDGDS